MLLIAAGCANKDTEEFVVVDENQASAKEEKPSLEVEVKVEGNKAVVYIDTDLKISKEHYGDEKSHGEGHIHLYLNNGEKQGITTVPYELKDLEKGDHEIRVSLHNNDHTPYGVSVTKEFRVQ